MGIEPLPKNLGEAIAVMERSELVAETLGEHVFDFFLRNKRDEWARVPPPGHGLRAGPLPAHALDPRAGRLTAPAPRPGGGGRDRTGHH